MKKPMTYRAAGVDLDAAHRAKRAMASLIAPTGDEHTLSGIGGFGGMYAVPDDVEEPVLVSSTDGVGTKLKVAFAAGRHDTVGRDLVNHCVNDILVQGARPLFFLDYLATGRVEEELVPAVVGGVAKACEENACALLGGETAEMGDFYAPGEYDLAGFVVGLVERRRILDGRAMQSGDALVALPSSGLHTNGYTLARAVVFERMGLGIDDRFPGESDSVAEVLLRVHRSYLGALWPLLERGEIRAMAHITGGGIEGNLSRVLPGGLGARIDVETWSVPNVFRQLARGGDIALKEMFRVFNMGVGMILVVAPGDVDRVVGSMGGHAWIVGEIVDGSGVVLTEVS